ncbi:MAG TPA: HPF/RaiA family ribosome-associated protein [Longimicrobiales bacterium]|nr:HPF/RaiA family ribosome-associated protein [Longimicrobiales bacterium]
MKIQVNTDRNVHGGEQLKDEVRQVVGATLDRFSDRLTRVEAHLSDDNSSAKGGADDMRCVLEARVAGANPMSVSHSAATLKEAVAGAADKLETVLQRHFDRQGQVKGRLSYGGAEAD